MDFAAILKRIDTEIAARNLTRAQVSERATGSPDTIRGWARAIEKDGAAGMTLSRVERVAEALDVSLEYLLFGHGRPSPQSEFSESEAAPYEGRAPGPGPSKSMYVARASALSFGIAEGDVLTLDLKASPRNGDIVIATLNDPFLGHAWTVVRRFAPPWLIPPVATVPLDKMDNNAAIMGVVVGIQRTIGTE